MNKYDEWINELYDECMIINQIADDGTSPAVGHSLVLILRTYTTRFSESKLLIYSFAHLLLHLLIQLYIYSLMY